VSEGWPVARSGLRSRRRFYGEPMDGYPVTRLLEIPIGDASPEIVNMIVEVPRDSANKYEYDPESGMFRLDRVLYSPLHYPGDYGFVPSTLAEDGDPLDILVLMGQPSFPGCLLRARPLGYLEMTDEKGPDQKVLAVPLNDPRYDGYRTLGDVHPHRLREIEHFFAIYKELEEKEVTVDGWRDAPDAQALVRATERRFAAAA
jgi:inorganic pyrophosphatase